MGLIMLILIGVLPGAFALQDPTSAAQFSKTAVLAQKAAQVFQAQSASAPSLGNPSGGNQTPAPDNASAPTTVEPATPSPNASAEASALHPNLTGDAATINSFVKTGHATPETYNAFARECSVVVAGLQGATTFSSLPKDKKEDLRKNIYLLDDGISKLNKLKLLKDKDQAKTLVDFQKDLETYTKYIPLAVKVMVALALGLGTMIGWKRIVVTVGEKIGKAHLTYGQGMSAEFVAAITILGASWYGWPVSTTHVLSSGIAGTMAANRSGLQTQTLINIVLAWVLTLPVCVFLGASLFSASLYVLFHFVGVH
jgi:PiT family inorganic phosphate transporter